jgi:formimidoylglutamate deiminase
MTSLFARKALLADGWSEAVRLRFADGRIADVETGTEPEPGEIVGGIAIPGLTNAHSHAFQRALAGRTEERGPATQDNFWTWRNRMYALAHRIDADALAAIAREAYCEMVASGYTGVVEFQYLLSEPGQSRPGMAMLRALGIAAEDSGIRLTYVPVLYERAGFDAPEPNEDQRRFATTLEAFEAHYREAQEAADGMRVGIGAHSLRAVSAESLARVARIAAEDSVPMHIHVAEQQGEVEQCLDALGTRPVRWLLREHDVDERWCLVHATHVDDDEVEKLAKSGAVVCVCPSTEANLGDGLFPLARYLEHDGRIAIGSDSHVSINPFEELRWLEYGQRLVSMTRNVAVHRRETHTGRSLFELAAEGGALAAGLAKHGLARGAPADLVVLDDDSPMLVGHEPESLLDALVFSGFTLPLAAEEAKREYARAVRRLFAKSG